MAENKGTPWEKLRRLLDAARRDEVSNRLRTESPSEVASYLEEEYGITGKDVAELMSEFERIADRNSVRWWSPIH